MYIWLSNIFILSLKEVKSLLSDLILVALMVYFFTVAVVVAAKGASQEVRNAPVAVADHDVSALSLRLMDAVRPPHFKIPESVSDDAVQRHMDLGDYYFVLDIPPNYEKDYLDGRNPRIQILVDATAMTLAGTGTGYLSSVLADELGKTAAAYGRTGQSPAEPAVLKAEPVINVMFNPNSSAIWQMGVVQIIGNLTLLTLMLSGAAVIREKERGTIEHLLVMPVSASEIAIAKVCANGSVIVLLALVSLWCIVHTWLGVPIEGNIGLLASGMLIYVLSFASLGIFLAVLAPSMPQFGLLCIPVYMLVYLLAGATSPVESMPETMQKIIQISPTAQFVSFVQDVVHRGSGLEDVYRRMLIMLGQGLFFLILALSRFKSMLSRQ
ncbi:ABC transporter permease [uncultured Ruminobacter sp.]|uniref:ABC transporter permease n=1 Tax=uncultured Ruminobacter sp. TaxID=538947 RepID=UPI0026212B05|nr:ABC transporter permease [uncultured Ruminobacter sp.]